MTFSFNMRLPQCFIHFDITETAHPSRSLERSLSDISRYLDRSEAISMPLPSLVDDIRG